MHKNAQTLNQALQNSYSQYSNVQSRLENSLDQVEQLKAMVRYYQSLVPTLNQYAQEYANVASLLSSNPYNQVSLPQYPQLPQFNAPVNVVPYTTTLYPEQSSYQQTANQQATIKPNGPNGYVYNDGKIKISYNSVEETFKTNSSMPLELMDNY